MEFLLHNVWAIAVIPVLNACVIAAFAKQLKDKAAYLGFGVMAVLLVWSTAILLHAVGMGGEGAHAAAAGAHAVAAEGAAWPIHMEFARWAVFGNLEIPIGIMVDNVTAIMLFVVTLVSTCVQIYSVGYMHGDKRFTRYFAAINLFTSGMLGLVLADNFFLLLVSWEIMGLCSYLLIGHWYEQDWPRRGSIKAFLTTRVGDVGMMIGIWMLYNATHSFKFAQVAAGVPDLVKTFGMGYLLVAGFLLFAGPMGKSAQFPLHTWLPDAMAGPTPGSALIHAATMVAAGVYLVARSFDILAQAPVQVMVFIAIIGAFTSFFAATIATIRSDVKEVLAYSTISQLGYMIMALGLGGFMAGTFHLMTHAFFKALLFLAAGSIIHGVHDVKDMHRMGNLRKKMPVTFLTWMVGYLALAGFPIIGAGFFSKDELLLAAFTWREHLEKAFGVHMTGAWQVIAWLPFILAAGTAVLTAYYMTRETILVFFGKERDHHVHEHAHESNWWMLLPMVILAIPALLSGYVQFPAAGIVWFEEFVGHITNPAYTATPEFSPLVMGIAIACTLVGMGVGYLIYGTNEGNIAFRARAIAATRPLYTLIKNKYYVDELYEAVFVNGTFALSRAVSWFDANVVDAIVNFVGWLGNWFAWFAGEVDKWGIDGLVNGAASLAQWSGRQLRKISTGYVQAYMLTLAAVVVLAVFAISVFGRLGG